tara:strand:+ start:37 stop:246 length:210 start_codon:yes stop_codon:yes gene_type:complete
MKKLIKSFKAWLASVSRTDSIWIVYTIKSDSVVSILIVTYEMEDAIEYMNMYNKKYKESSAWLTKQIIV